MEILNNKYKFFLTFMKKKKEKKGKWGYNKDGDYVGFFTKKEMIEMIKGNQDICFHKDGYIQSYSAGH